MIRASQQNHTVDIDSIISRMNKLELNNSNTTFPLNESEV